MRTHSPSSSAENLRPLDVSPPPVAMHGAENYFLIFDIRRHERISLPKNRAEAEALIGGRQCDQLLFLEPAQKSGDFRLTTINCDGSPAEFCGNGARCVAAMLLQGEAEGKTLAMEAGQSIIRGWREGEQIWIELDGATPRKGAALAEMPASLQNWHEVQIANPHAVFLLPQGEEGEAMRVDWADWGKKLAAHPEMQGIFPQGVNISFVQALSQTRLRMQTYERGAGLTQACGSGALAGFLAARAQGLCGETATIEMPGGILPVRTGEAGRILLSGPVCFLDG